MESPGIPGRFRLTACRAGDTVAVSEMRGLNFLAPCPGGFLGGGGDCSREGGTMKADRLVAAIQDAARKHDGLAMLGGLVGDGAKSGLVRLYLRPELDWYVEFPEKAVVHRLELPAEASFLGGSLLWVVPGTKLTDVKSSRLAEQASFLRGSLIESQLLKGESPMAVAAAVPTTGGCVVATVIGTVIIAGITYASYHYCATGTNATVLNSALQNQQCVTTNATVICHPQTGATPPPRS